MIKQIKRYLAIIVLALGIGSLTACNTTTKIIKHGNLQVETKVSGAPREAHKEK